MREGAASTSNVYYLPAVTTPAAPAAEQATGRQTRMHGLWWRLRLAVAGVRLAMRPAHMPLFAEDDEQAVLQGRAELIERVRRSRPARVIDFDAARARLRPVAAQ